MKKKIVVSACLLGTPCRYDGKSKPCDKVVELARKYELIPVCPEVLGGLPTPRIPSERVGERVVTRDGRDVTENYNVGAMTVLEICKLHGASLAILKARSPACGSGEIYDGSFSGSLTKGDGVCAEALIANGVSVYSEETLEK